MRLLLLFPLCLASMLGAETRLWTSANGESSFQGEFISRDTEQVTIKRSDGKNFTFAIAKLCEDDRNWLATQSTGKIASADPEAVFDQFCLGDSRDEVETKVAASKMLVKTDQGSSVFGSHGINGIYQTKQQIGGLDCVVYFEWDHDSHLQRLSLKTEPCPLSAYDEGMKAAWSEMIEILTMLHGKPFSRGMYPDPGTITEGMFSGSHIWHLPAGGSALLGTMKQNDRFRVIVRFTTEKIKPTIVRQ